MILKTLSHIAYPHFKKYFIKKKTFQKIINTIYTFRHCKS